MPVNIERPSGATASVKYRCILHQAASAENLAEYISQIMRWRRERGRRGGGDEARARGEVAPRGLPAQGDCGMESRLGLPRPGNVRR